MGTLDEEMRARVDRARKVRAPIGATFVGWEGETGRVGQRTAFIHVANGVERTADEMVAWFSQQHAAALVLDVCECAWFRDWNKWVAAFMEVLAFSLDHRACPVPTVVLETRGNQHVNEGEVAFRDRYRGIAGVVDELYLNLSPGYTVLVPDDVVEVTVKRGKRLAVKALVTEKYQTADAIRALKPWAEAGAECFLLPRVGGDVKAARDILAFAAEFYPEMPHFRAMLIEHELLEMP